MANRFTDSRKWDDPWFTELELKYKMLWLYMLDKCNHAGIYKPNLKLAEFLLGEKFTQHEILQAFSGRIEVTKSGNWAIPKFVDFQYGELNDDNRVHASVINILKKEGAYKGLTSPMEGRKNKDKDKDKDKDIYIEFVKLSKEEHKTLIDTYGEKIVKEYVGRLNDYIGSKGKKYKSHYHTLLVWIKKDAPQKLSTGKKAEPKKDCDVCGGEGYIKDREGAKCFCW